MYDHVPAGAAGIFRAADHDDPNLCRHDVEALGHLLADPARRARAARTKSAAVRMIETRHVFEANFRVCGVRKVCRTTRPDPEAVRPLDRVHRQFKAPRPNALRISDFTTSRPGQPSSTPPSSLTFYPPDRWLPALAHRPCRLRARPSGAGLPRAPPCSGWRARHFDKPHPLR